MLTHSSIFITFRVAQSTPDTQSRKQKIHLVRQNGTKKQWFIHAGSNAFHGEREDFYLHMSVRRLEDVMQYRTSNITYDLHITTHLYISYICWREELNQDNKVHHSYKVLLQRIHLEAFPSSSVQYPVIAQCNS